MRLRRSMWARISRQASAASWSVVGSWLSPALRKSRAASGVSKPRRARIWPATRDSRSSLEMASEEATEKASQVHREGRESTEAIVGSPEDVTRATSRNLGEITIDAKRKRGQTL